MFGKSPIVTEVLEAPPTDFKPAPEERVAVLSKDSKSLKNLVKSRDAYFKEDWGFVQFCKVCSKANLPARFQKGTHASNFMIVPICSRTKCVVMFGLLRSAAVNVRTCSQNIGSVTLVCLSWMAASRLPTNN